MKYRLLWQNQYLNFDPKNIDDIIKSLEEGMALLQEMKASGIVLETYKFSNNCVYLGTDDVTVAKKFGFHETLED